MSGQMKHLTDVEWIARQMLAEAVVPSGFDGAWERWSRSFHADYRKRARQAIRLVAAAKRRR